jgi:hypothetical protein
MSCLGFLRSQCDSYWLRDAGTRLAGVEVALRIDSNVKYWFVAPAGSRWTRGMKIPFLVEGGEAGLFLQFGDLD